VRDQVDTWARFAVIKYLDTEGKWVYSGRRYNNTASYICQLQQQGKFLVAELLQG